MKEKLLIAIVLLVAAPLSATWFEVSPAAPTSRTPVAITFITDSTALCNPTRGIVNINGKVVNVRLVSEADGCPADVTNRRLTVDIGTLPFGEYTLHAEYDRFRWDGKFVVRNPLVRLNAVPSIGGSPVSVAIVEPGFCAADCAVTFGGTSAVAVRIEGGMLVATAPAHATGVYDIRAIGSSGRAIDLPGAIYFYDLAQPPDQTVFEPVLFPVLDSASGASGSRWTSTASIENASAYYQTMYNRLDNVVCIDFPCTEVVPPRTLYTFNGEGRPHGGLLWVPRDEPDTWAFGLRIRETSRNDDPGVEIVPVREARFSRRMLTLLNVPIASSVRTKVRIYGVDPLPQTGVSVTAVISRNPFRGWATIVPLRRSGDQFDPPYAEIDLQSVPELQGLDTTTVYVHAPFNARTWTFASVVDNASQHMLVIEGQHP